MECLLFSDSSDDEFIENLVEMYEMEREKPQRIENFMSVVSNSSDNEFRQHFRLRRVAFEDLLGKLDIGGEINKEKQLLAFLWLMATPDSFRSVGNRFDIAKSTLSKIFDRVVLAISKVSKNYIHWPNFVEKQQIKQHNATRRLNDCIGALDGCHIRVHVPSQLKLVHTNRKMFTSIVLQAVCDHRMVFTDVFAGYPGSVHDARVSRNSDLWLACERDKDQFFDGNEYIVADQGYPLNDWIITPYGGRGAITPVQKKFNEAHASCGVVIERSFGLLLGRFRRLRDLHINKFESASSVVLAACVLHNICQMHPEQYDTSYVEEGLDFIVMDSRSASDNEPPSVKRDEIANYISN